MLILNTLSHDEPLVKYRKVTWKGQYFLQETGIQMDECDSQLQTKPMACQEVFKSIRFWNCKTWTCRIGNITFLERLSLVSLTVLPEH